jgi:hypothetical protein
MNLYFDDNMLFLCPASGAMVTTAGLKQGKVSIVANGDCKSDPDIGKFVTELNTCINTLKVSTCPVSIDDSLNSSSVFTFLKLKYDP